MKSLSKLDGLFLFQERGEGVHCVKEAEKAMLAGADYFGVGPIFPTEIKKDTRAVQGPALINKLIDFEIPIVGIGGINSENASLVLKAGAVITAISHAIDVREAAARVRGKFFLLNGGRNEKDTKAYI
jgi:thiamine-phosphate pyrophosphorylase